MKAIKIFIVIFLLVITCASSQAGEWTRDSLDNRRAIANNSKPPARKIPVHSLDPVNDNGIIRRVKLPEGVKAVSLTFDMCELDTITTGCDMDVINFLRENNIPVTLFMGGKWMRTHSRRVMQIMSAKNFEIANHNWSHGNCALLSDSGLKAQILWTQSQYELLREESENDDIPPSMKLFRLPYGRSSRRAINIINSLGFRIIQWDVAAESGNNENIKTARRNALKVANMTRPGSILLFHANLVPRGTINLLREVVKILSERGYKFVNVSELLLMGEPEIIQDGYFTKSGDNLQLDKKFGIDGTGRKTRFTGE